MKRYLLTLSLCFLVIITIGAISVHAGVQTGIEAKIENPFKGGGDLEAIFTSIVNNILLPIGGVIAVIAFIWVGFMFVTAQGDPGKLTTARTALWYTTIGTLILLGASAILLVIKSTITLLKN